jgi:hypothetical protein
VQPDENGLNLGLFLTFSWIIAGPYYTNLRTFIIGNGYNTIFSFHLGAPAATTVPGLLAALFL